MTIDEAKKLITNHNIDKNTYLPAIHSFVGEEKEENYYSLMILVGLFDIFYSEEAYKYLVLLLENFKNKLDNTPQNMGYYFYGNENADVTAITDEYPGIHTPLDLYDALSNVWCEYTCAPRLRRQYNTAHKTCGQCSITAFLVQDIFGGRVYGIPRESGNFHCYNEVDGHVFDITSEQFPNEELCYKDNPEQFREVHFAREEKRRRYEYLRKALKRACGVMPDYRYIFFDLDGTLTQSEFGIVDSVTYALRKFGIEGESREKLKQFIGPALFESFQNLYHFNKEDADRAVVYYREFYEAEGIYMSPLYDGVEKMLRDLDEKGKELYVVTAKPQEMAEKVLRHTGILGYFQGVIGPDRSARKTDKASLIRRAFELLSKEADNIDRIAEQSLMVGDRHYDMEGAAEAGVDSMGVLYGYGSRQELCWSGASYLAETPPEVTERICGFMKA
jgi:phosphoglycolate phosphatase